MKSNILNLTLLLIIFSIYFLESKDENYLTVLNLKGEIKSVREISYKIEKKTNSELEEVEEIRWVHESLQLFNKQGNSTGLLFFDIYGNLTELSVSIYDSLHFRTDNRSFDSEFKLESSSKYIYDEQDNLIEHVDYNLLGKEIYKKKYNYDDSGNRIKEYFLKNDSTMLRITKNKFDLVGNKVESFHYDSKGYLERKTKTDYDEFGNITMYRKYDSKLVLELKIVYVLDKFGNNLETRYYGKDGSLKECVKSAYNYDDNNNWILMNCLSNDHKWFVKREIEYY